MDDDDRPERLWWVERTTASAVKGAWLHWDDSFWVVDETGDATELSPAFSHSSNRRFYMF
jgi:hypothetical protein